MNLENRANCILNYTQTKKQTKKEHKRTLNTVSMTK